MPKEPPSPPGTLTKNDMGRVGVTGVFSSLGAALGTTLAFYLNAPPEVAAALMVICTAGVQIATYFVRNRK